MAESVGKVYAGALFSLAVENGVNRPAIDGLLSDIVGISKILDSEPEFAGLLSSPSLSKGERAAAFSKVFENDKAGVKGGGPGYAQNLYKLLISKNRLPYRGEVIDEFRGLYNKQFGIEEVTVTSAMPLSSTEKMKIMAKLSDSLKKEIVLLEKTDPSLVGGIVIDTSDGRLDGSVKTRLAELRKTL